ATDDQLIHPMVLPGTLCDTWAPARVAGSEHDQIADLETFGRGLSALPSPPTISTARFEVGTRSLADVHSEDLRLRHVGRPVRYGRQRTVVEQLCIGTGQRSDGAIHGRGPELIAHEVLAYDRGHRIVTPERRPTEVERRLKRETDGSQGAKPRTKSIGFILE